MRDDLQQRPRLRRCRREGAGHRPAKLWRGYVAQLPNSAPAPARGPVPGRRPGALRAAPRRGCWPRAGSACTAPIRELLPGRQGLRGSASKLIWMADGRGSARTGARRWSRAPGCPARRRSSRPRASAGPPVIGELELGLAAAPEPLRRRHRHERQDHRRRVARPRLPRRPASPSPSPATSARRSPRWPARSTASATVICECSSFQLEDSIAFAPEVRRPPQRHPRPPRPPRDLDAYLDGEAADLRQPGQRRRRRLRRRRPGARRRRAPGRRARRVAYGDRRAAPTATARSAAPTATIVDAGEPLIEAAELRAGRRAQRRATRWPPPRPRSRRASPRRRRARACAASPASRTGSSGSREIGGVLFVNDSKATNVAAAIGRAALLRRRRPRDPRRQRSRAAASRRSSGRSPSAAAPAT